MPQLVTLATLGRSLSDRLGGLFTAAGLDGGPASDVWLDPLSYSLNVLGVPLADPTTVTDSDLGAVTADQVNQLLDVAEWRAAVLALLGTALVDQKINTEEIKFSQARLSIEAHAAGRLAFLKSAYGFGVMAPSSGTLPGVFAASGVWCA